MRFDKFKKGMISLALAGSFVVGVGTTSTAEAQTWRREQRRERLQNRLERQRERELLRRIRMMDRDRQVRCRGRRAPQGAALDHRQERAHQHQRDQAPGARRPARGPVDRRAAAEPRQLPPRDEALARVGDPLRRAGRQDHLRRPARRRGDVALGDLLGGARPAAYAARGHRLRLRRGEDDLRPHRREGLDQQGRDHARRLRHGPRHRPC